MSLAVDTQGMAGAPGASTPPAPGVLTGKQPTLGPATAARAAAQGTARSAESERGTAVPAAASHDGAGADPQGALPREAQLPSVPLSANPRGPLAGAQTPSGPPARIAKGGARRAGASRDPRLSAAIAAWPKGAVSGDSMGGFAGEPAGGDPSVGTSAAPGDARPGPACASLGEPAGGPAGEAVPRGARTAPAGALPAAGGAAQRVSASLLHAAEAKPVSRAGEQNGSPGGAVPRSPAGVAVAAQPASGVPGAGDGGARAVGGAPGAVAEASLVAKVAAGGPDAFERGTRAGAGVARDAAGGSAPDAAVKDTPEALGAGGNARTAEGITVAAGEGPRGAAEAGEGGAGGGGASSVRTRGVFTRLVSPLTGAQAAGLLAGSLLLDPSA